MNQNEVFCRECGEPIECDPNGSEGAIVHSRSLGDTAFDLDENHIALPEMNDDERAEHGVAILRLAAKLGVTVTLTPVTAAAVAKLIDGGR